MRDDHPDETNNRRWHLGNGRASGRRVMRSAAYGRAATSRFHASTATATATAAVAHRGEHCGWGGVGCPATAIAGDILFPGTVG